jgi:hypothetical protein
VPTKPLHLSLGSSLSLLNSTELTSIDLQKKRLVNEVMFFIAVAKILLFKECVVRVNRLYKFIGKSIDLGGCLSRQGTL